MKPGLLQFIFPPLLFSFCCKLLARVLIFLLLLVLSLLMVVYCKFQRSPDTSDTRSSLLMLDRLERSRMYIILAITHQPNTTPPSNWNHEPNRMRSVNAAWFCINTLSWKYTSIYSISNEYFIHSFICSDSTPRPMLCSIEPKWYLITPQWKTDSWWTFFKYGLCHMARLIKSQCVQMKLQQTETWLVSHLIPQSADIDDVAVIFFIITYIVGITW